MAHFRRKINLFNFIFVFLFAITLPGFSSKFEILGDKGETIDIQFEEEGIQNNRTLRKFKYYEKSEILDVDRKFTDDSGMVATFDEPLEFD